MLSHLARMAFRAPLSSFDRDLLLAQTRKPSEEASKPEFLVGLSVGQGLQPSGIAVLERFSPSRPGGSRSYACRYLRRWLPPATAYPVLVRDLSETMKEAEADWWSPLSSW